MFSTLYNDVVNQYLLFDLQIMRVDLGRFACSYGMGWRISSDDCLETFGVNVFYDARRFLKTFFNQLGFGVELFSKCWDFRFNGYLPIGKKEAFETTGLLDFGDGYIAEKKQNQTAMWGLDVEVGTNFFLWDCCSFYLGLGPYFYNTFQDCSYCSDALLGGAARGFFCWNQCLAAEIFISYDPFFKTKIQGQLTLNISWSKCCSLFYPLLKVQRNRVITTHKTCKWDTNY